MNHYTMFRSHQFLRAKALRIEGLRLLRRADDEQYLATEQELTPTYHNKTTIGKNPKPLQDTTHKKLTPARSIKENKMI